MYRGMIVRKTPEQIDKMAASGEVLVRCLRMLASKARPGVTTEELDAAAEKFIRSQGAEPAFKGYRGFPGSICASPNSMVVHGIPGPYECKRGDVLSIDVGVIKDGWVSDAAVTLPIGPISPEARKLLDVTKASLFAAVEQMQPGNHLGDVSASIQRTVEIEGLSIIRTLVGHGIGREHARGPPGPQLRRAGQGPAARGGHGPRDRADGQRRRPPGPDGRRRLVRLLPGRLPRRPLRVHRRRNRRGPRILTPWHEDE